MRPNTGRDASSVVGTAIDALNAADAAGVAALLAPDVRLWIPEGAGWRTGRETVERLLASVIRDRPGWSLMTNAVVAGADAVVVELIACPPAGRGLPVTLVVFVQNGLVTTCRAYLDLEAAIHAA